MKLKNRDKRQLLLYNNLFSCLTTTFKKNSVDYANLYSKKDLARLISVSFGISDQRSIRSKIDFAISNNFIFVCPKGYSINKDIEKYYKEFLEKNKEYLEEIREI